MNVTAKNFSAVGVDISKTEITKYKHWDVYPFMPDGWREDKSVGSPLHGHVVAVNQHNFLSGKQKRGLVPVHVKQSDIQPSFDLKEPYRKVEKSKPPVLIDENYRKTVNELARKKFQHQMLKDIQVDLMVCELEGWDKMEYLKEICYLINGLGKPEQ